MSTECVDLLFTLSEAFNAIDFPQYLKTGISVEPSPTAMQSQAAILLIWQKSFKQSTLFPAFMYLTILPVNFPHTTS